MLLIDPYLKTSRQFENVVGNYFAALEASSFENVNAAAFLRNYFHSESTAFFKRLESLKSDLNNLDGSIIPASSSVTGRKKAFYSLCTKAVRESPNLDEVRDIYGIRTVVSSHVIGEHEAVKMCYTIATAYLKYFNAKKRYFAIPIQAKQTTKVDEDGNTVIVPLPEDILRQLYIPSDEIVLPLISGYGKYLKDYIRQPKAPYGYQSVHLLVLDMLTGKYIEIQIRTSNQHDYAENGPAQHDGIYKDEENIFLQSDIEGIKIENGKVINDPFGLFKGPPIGTPCVIERDGDPITWLG